MTKKIDILIKEPGQPWRLATVEDTLPVYQQIVGGYIEGVTTTSTGVHIFANEEGKLLGLEPNFWIHGDVIVGTAFAVRSDEEGEFQSVTPDDLARFTDFPQYL